MMSCRGRGPKALGLSFAVALATVTFSAATAQANGDFMVELKALLTNQIAKAAGASEELVLLLVPEMNMLIDCEDVIMNATLLSAGTAHWSMVFIECSLMNDEFKVLNGCELDPITAKGLALVVSNELLLLSPPPGPGEPFSTIRVLGEECPVGEANYQVTGSLLAKLTPVPPVAECGEARILLLDFGIAQGAGHGMNFGLHVLVPDIEIPLLLVDGDQNKHWRIKGL